MGYQVPFLGVTIAPSHLAQEAEFLYRPPLSSLGRAGVTHDFFVEQAQCSHHAYNLHNLEECQARFVGPFWELQPLFFGEAPMRVCWK